METAEKHGFQPGSLVQYRGREWVVLPSDDPSLTYLKPLGGSEEEAVAVFTELSIPGEEIEPTRLPYPDSDDIGDFNSAKLLHNACRLSFRNAAGPFRSVGKLSFRPRSYQMVPLITALKQDPVRLLIGDDVGVGKTVESLIILRELLERRAIKSFAVIAPPHLCDQWEHELQDKLDIEAVAIKSSTASSLDRRTPDTQTLFDYFPYQVISIDYIKTDERKSLFESHCPDLVIVDEVHTCARPDRKAQKAQQQRHKLIRAIADKPGQHLIGLTATPHSGKDEEFRSLLGFFNSNLEQVNLENASQNERKKVAQHFIQRKRKDIEHWVEEDTPFPERTSFERNYKLNNDYTDLFKQVRDFARAISDKDEKANKKRVRYWAALTLLKGTMSSPACAKQMLNTKYENKLTEQESSNEEEQSSLNLLDRLELNVDTIQTNYIEQAGLQDSELQQLFELGQKASVIEQGNKDNKLKATLDITQDWLNRQHNPIIFCRYIPTAKYVGEYLRKKLPKDVGVETVTSELVDEQRKEKVDALGNYKKRVLVATECLSEGINLQAYFTAVLHYDLPWNPNRLEQREGRIDRFGQRAEKVETALLYSEDNPVDQFILGVLLRKIRQIQEDIGVVVSLGEDNTEVMDAAVEQLLLDPAKSKQQKAQPEGTLPIEFPDYAPAYEADRAVENQMQKAKDKATRLRNVFSHSYIDPGVIEKSLREVDEAIGNLTTVEDFVKQGVTRLGAEMKAAQKGWYLYPTNLPQHLKDLIGNRGPVPVSFDSPTPEGYRYIGRNHRFVEQLCQFMLRLAFEGDNNYQKIGRSTVTITDAVSTKTVLFQFRVRNLIEEQKQGNQVVAEEMYLTGYQAHGRETTPISHDEAKQLLDEASPVDNYTPEAEQNMLADEISKLQQQQDYFERVARDRAEHLIEAHTRFQKLLKGNDFDIIEPVLPPDIIGLHMLMPPQKNLF